MNIKEIEFHDLPLDSLYLDFVSEKITIIYKTYKDETSEYFLRKLLFREVRNISLSCPNIAISEALEISEVNYLDTNGINKINFVFLTGFGKPNMDLSFEYSDVDFIE